MEIADPRIPPALLPKGSVARVVNGPDQEYLDLPSVITPDRKLISRWTLTPEERLKIAEGADIYVTLWGLPINPLLVTVGPIDWTEL